jgi:hypothetical protein
MTHQSCHIWLKISVFRVIIKNHHKGPPNLADGQQSGGRDVAVGPSGLHPQWPWRQENMPREPGRRDSDRPQALTHSCDACSRQFSSMGAMFHVSAVNSSCKPRPGAGPGYSAYAAPAKESGTKRPLMHSASSSVSSAAKKRDSPSLPPENVLQEERDDWDSHHDAPDMQMPDGDENWPFGARWCDRDSFVGWTKDSNTNTRCPLTLSVTRCTLLLLLVPSLSFLTTCTHPFTLHVLSHPLRHYVLYSCSLNPPCPFSLHATLLNYMYSTLSHYMYSHYMHISTS